jgi:hypothetical protein
MDLLSRDSDRVGGNARPHIVRVDLISIFKRDKFYFILFLYYPYHSHFIISNVSKKERVAQYFRKLVLPLISNFFNVIN